MRNTGNNNMGGSRVFREQSRVPLQVGGRKVVRLGDKDVEWDDSFRLYLVTHLPNPAYGPEVASRTMLINYSVAEQARPGSHMPVLSPRQSSTYGEAAVGS